MVSVPWVNKYAPTKLSEVIGQTKAIKQFATFINNFPKTKAVLFAGLPGIGKTSTIKAFANEFNFEVVELNASDKRNKSSIMDTILPASQQASIFGNKKIIVLDEIDGLSGRKDRGGATELLKVIEKTKYPIIMSANDAYSKKLKTIRKKSTIISFSRVNYLSMAKRLRKICEKEGVKYDAVALQNIASSAQGDLRAAINDLQLLSSDGAITCERLLDQQRKQEETIFELLKLTFKSNNVDAISSSINNITEDYGILTFWIDENMPKEYRGIALKKGYDCLSKADIFKRRIMKRQHWRFLAYIKDILSVGVQQSKRNKMTGAGWVSYRPPALMLKIWHKNMRRKKRLAELETATEKLHASAYRLERDFLPYFEFIATKNKAKGKEIKDWLSN